MTHTRVIALFIVVCLIVAGWFYYEKYFRGVGPAIGDPPDDITELLDPVHNINFPLTLPAGFEISVFAKNLPGARDMAFDGFGNMVVSQTREGKISLLYIRDSVVYEQRTILSGLNRPHGVTLNFKDPNTLYFTEQNKISKLRLYSEMLPEKIVDLPYGGNHTNYSLRFGPDERLYVGLGSTCNVCHEKDRKRGTIQVVDVATQSFQEFAKGLRNAPFFTWSYVDGRMWATEMGRDFLGDDLPPDEVNIIREGGNYGWPICYGKNIHDTDFDKNVYARNPCMEPFEVPSHVDLDAHSAPLGLGFIPEEGWPEEYWHDLIVAFHGSWNRSTPTGYKLVRVQLDAKGNYEGTEDFITGWLTPEGALGRPVGVLILPGGIMYVSDDHAGVIYKIIYRGVQEIL